MIKSVIVTNHLGESLEMVLANPWDTGFAITSIKGLGPSKANINVTDIATSDGAIYNSARQNKRNIVFKIQFVGTELIETLRQKTYKYFPIKKKVALRFVTDNRDVEIIGYVESNEPDIFRSDEFCQISIICPDPNFYSAGDDGESSIDFNTFSSLFEFPWDEIEWEYWRVGVTYEVGDLVQYYGNYYTCLVEHTAQASSPPPVGVASDIWDLEDVGDFEVPHGFENYTYYDEYTSRTLYTLEFGSIETMAMYNIEYTGDVDTGVLITLHATGGVTNPSIYDITTQQTITIDTTILTSLTGSGMIASDTIYISTVKGDKYVKLLRQGVEYNIINCVGKNVGWFQLSKGDNVFAFGATSGTEYLQVSLTNKVLYEGI